MTIITAQIHLNGHGELLAQANLLAGMAYEQGKCLDVGPITIERRTEDFNIFLDLKQEYEIVECDTPLRSGWIRYMPPIAPDGA